MADLRWIKITTDIFDDEKILLIESMPEHESIIVIWFKLLCLAGKQNNSGVFTFGGQMAYTDEMFATIFRRPLNTIRLAFHTFEQFGMIEVINGTVTIPNWGKHQKLDALENRREYQKNYMRQYRQKQQRLTSGETCCKPNSISNVSGAEENRREENRKEENKEDSPVAPATVSPSIPETKPKKKARIDTEEIFSRYTQDEKTLGLLREWLKVRKAKRAPETEKALTLNLDKLHALATESGMGDAEYLEGVIARGWAAFYPLESGWKRQAVPERSRVKTEAEHAAGGHQSGFGW